MAEFGKACKSAGLLPFSNTNRIHVVPPCTMSDDEAREVRAAAARALSRLSFDRADAYVRVLESTDMQTLRDVAQACVKAGLAAQAISRLASEDRRQAYLASVWCELVGVKNIRSNDNFFDIGGHSLLAVEFTTRVHRETGVRLSLLAVATSTLASLATELSEESEWSNGATGRTSASLRERLRRLWRSN